MEPNMNKKINIAREKIHFSSLWYEELIFEPL